MSINKIFHLPNDQYALENMIKHLKKCNILSSKTSENLQGPEIEETYECPCGNITLKQNSIITNIDHPEIDNIEIIHMQSQSKGCVL
jgi:hypothetical protein